MCEQISIAGCELLPLLDELGEGIAIAAPNAWNIVFINSTLAEWLGKQPTELVGITLDSLFHSDAVKDILHNADHLLQDPHSKTRIRARLQSEAALAAPTEAVEIRFCRLVIGSELLVGMVVSQTANCRDPLTGLRDRNFLMQRLAKLLGGDRTADRQFALMFIDLDNFKRVNDSHGHLVGDRVLREVARRLSGCVRDGDHVVRFGGDEFVVLVELITEERQLQPIVHRICEAFANPITLSQGEFTLSLSIGAAIATPNHHTPDDILRDADRAMYATKGSQVSSPQ